MSPPRPATHILTLSCPDRAGIVHAVAGAIVEAGGNIVESQQYGDEDTGRFFMRVEVAATDGAGDPGSALRTGFAAIASRFGMEWQLHAGDEPARTLVLVSLGGHCLNDLMFRARSGALPITVPAVVSNHPGLRDLADFYGVPFVHIPVTPRTRDDAEARLGRW